MKYEDTYTVVSAYLKDNFTGYPLVASNRRFEPTTGQVWLRWGINPNLEQAIEVGGTYGRTIGFIWFQIFLPENSGSKEANKVGDKLSALFFQKTLTATGKPVIICEAASLRKIGQEVSGAEQWNVTIPYRVDSAA